MTIEERAEIHLHKRMPAIARVVEQNNLSKEVRKSMTFHCYHDYKIGATEQKAIDIDKAQKTVCQFLCACETKCKEPNMNCDMIYFITKSLKEE